MSALDYAIQSNNVHKVKRLLACGATYEYETLVRSLSSSSTSPEEISRKCVIAKMMLSDCINNAEFQQSDDIGVLLCMASVRGDEKTIVSQLQRASLNFTDEITYTSSILMAALNSIDVIRSLETSGCVLSEDHLISAISSGNYEVAIYLQQKMISSLSALRLAVQYGQSELTRTFMDFSEKSNNLNSNNYVELDSLLVSAVESGDVNTVQAIIEYGTSYTPDVLYLALQKAIYTDNQDILSFLINEIGCDINYYSTGQMSLLEFAIYHGNYEMFLLLALNDSIILEDSNTYLDAAIIKNNNGVLQHLLEIGIDPNIENPSDNPLIEAIRRGNMDAINLLLEAGADINLKLIYPPTPNEGNEEKFIYPIHEAAKNFSSRILARLIESGADIHLVDSKGRSPLDLAVTSYNYEVIEGELVSVK